MSFEFGELSFTVQNVVIQDGKILLVHEKDHAGEGGRRPGWNLFGGNTEGWDINRTYRQIINFLPVEVDINLDEEFFRNFIRQERMDNEFFSFFRTHKEYGNYVTLLGSMVYFTAIREGIEETGLLVRPTAVLFEELTKSENHRLIVVHSEIVLGKIKKRSLETYDCGWFDLRNLPEGTFPSHRSRIALAVYKLGIRDEKSGQLLDLFV